MLYDQQSRGQIMDAVQNLFKKTALFLVIALAVAIPGRAQAPSFTAPGTVSLSGSGGQDVTIGSTGDSITFTFTTVYSAGDPSWLNVSGGLPPLTTPRTLAFNLGNTAGLTQGTHTATVTLHATSPSGVAAANITV